jgi:hypothetical protein
MALYANAEGADTTFYLARVFPGSAGRILHLQFFDTGDASDPGDLTVLPPAENGGGFKGCSYERPEGSATQLTDPNDCTINGLIRTQDNGHWIDIYVPIPADYTCSTSSPTGCWVRLKFKYGAGTSVHDVTTWAAEIIGDPVRLVK